MYAPSVSAPFFSLFDCNIEKEVSYHKISGTDLCSWSACQNHSKLCEIVKDSRPRNLVHVSDSLYKAQNGASYLMSASKYREFACMSAVFAFFLLLQSHHEPTVSTRVRESAIVGGKEQMMSQLPLSGIQKTLLLFLKRQFSPPTLSTNKRQPRKAHVIENSVHCKTRSLLLWNLRAAKHIDILILYQ